MEQADNIFDKIREIVGLIPCNVSILEEQIDANIQLEYQNFMQDSHNVVDADDILKNRNMISRQDLSIEDKKLFIARLASTNDIKAYRMLEHYLHNTPGKLKEWTLLALNDCRLLIESKILDENQVLISTGLGGKNMNLRYFTVLVSQNGMKYLPFQQKIITVEILKAMKKAGGECEKIAFDNELCSVTSLIPLNVPVRRLFVQAIRECNDFGDFICTDYFITNMKIFSACEIREMIQCSSIKNKTRNE